MDVGLILSNKKATPPMTAGWLEQNTENGRGAIYGQIKSKTSSSARKINRAIGFFISVPKDKNVFRIALFLQTNFLNSLSSFFERNVIFMELDL
jgi:hypothetical protein